MFSCSEIWPGIRGQPCASVWQVRKHLSGRGRSVAQCCFKLTALERQGNLSDREIASTHQFTVVEKTVVRGAWGHLDPRPRVLNEELVPGKWLLLAVENFGSTWGKCLPRCPHFIFPIHVGPILKSEPQFQIYQKDFEYHSEFLVNVW